MVADLDLTENEEVIDQVVVRVWKLARIWMVFLVLPLVFALPYADRPYVGVPLVLIALWASTYFFRQRWRFTLTNRQIAVRQLLPRPLTAISRIYYFPLNKIEGLSIGPRAFRTILLIGIFVATNVGVTLLKSGLSLRSGAGFDLPDTVDAIFLVMSGIPFIQLDGFIDDVESGLDALFSTSADVLVGMGISLIVIGFITVLLTLPRRYHLQIRVRHGADFRLAAGVPRDFWEKCYNQLYKDEIVQAPEEFKKWRFPWLKGEKKETSADLEEIIYTNRFIGIFAIYAGSFRVWQRIQQGRLGEDVVLWVLVALVDIFIAVVAVVFSKKKNEMVVTNRRIIFAQEMQDLSGAFGRRLYLMSDISRNDVAGFRLFRVKGISYRYFILTVLFTIITVTFWRDLGGSTLLSIIFIRGIFVFLILLFATFITQTYLEFNLKTKGNEVWNMRHQLSNPLTMMRQLIGNDENIVLTTLLSNRLEEKEVVDTIQILRASELGLKPKLFEDSKYYGAKYESSDRTSREVNLQDLLLEEETVKYETNVSRGVPRRKLNLSIATLLMLSVGSSLVGPLVIADELSLMGEEVLALMIILPIIVILFLVGALWVRYYSLFQARLLFTEKRAFFTDIKNPPLLIYLLGIHEESTIEETLQSEVHSTYTSRQLSQQQYFRDFMYHGFRFAMYTTLFGISMGVLESISTNMDIVDQYPAIRLFFPIVFFIAYVGALSMSWHFGNLYIAMIRSFPRRVVHTQGVGSHFIVPFANKKKAEQISQTVWEGIITE